MTRDILDLLSTGVVTDEDVLCHWLLASCLLTPPQRGQVLNLDSAAYIYRIVNSHETLPSSFPITAFILHAEHEKICCNGKSRELTMGDSMNESHVFQQGNGHNPQAVASSSAHPYPTPLLRSRTGTSVLGPNSRTFQRTATNMFRPEKKLGPAPNFLQSLKAIILASWLNLLLVCIPVSWALNFAIPSTNKNKDTIVFVFSFLAIIPLAKLMGFATEELSLRVGQTLAGLLNATLGNAVELIVAIIALVKCQLRIVQASLVGSVLSNLLLVLGMCFFAGGVKYSEQGFGVSSTQLNSSLLTISVIAVLLPAAFHFSADAQLSNDDEAQDILAVSHGVAIILLFIYAGYLWFQLVSHTDLYQDSGKHVIESTSYGQPNKLLARLRRKKDVEFQETKQPATRSSTMTGSTMSGPTTHGGVPSGVQNGSLTTHVEETSAEEEEEEEELPQMSVWMTIVLLVIVTVLVAITAEWLVDSIDGLTESGKISKEFVGIILLPIVGNAAEHVTAVTVSVKDKLTLSLGVAVGSSIQIALFVIPFIVILAWILGKPLTLLFDPFESIAMFLSVLTVNYVVQDGKSNWLEGFILMALYLILAVTFWFYPGSDPSGVLKTCT